MDFVLTEEQEELQRVVRAFLTDQAPTSATRRLMETDLGYDREVWRLMAEQLGLQGLCIPEELGGAGLGPVELALVFEEAGAALACAPLLSTMGLAVSALLAAPDDTARADLLPGIASGATVATLALCEDDGRWDEAGTRVTATPSGPTGDGGSGWVLDGVKSYVTDGLSANLILLTARSEAGVALFAVTGDAGGGLSRSRLTAMDLTRPMARLELAATPARLVGPDGGGWPVVERALIVHSICLAAEQVGVAQRCLAMLVDYAKQRRQFGRAIGSFQAVKHASADILVALEQARSATYYAAAVAAEGSIAPGGEGGEAALAASLARVSAARAAQMAGRGAVHFHGALGFTWEHDAHLYFKRARSSALMLGDPTHHRRVLARHLGL